MFVGALPFDVKEDDLRQHFAQCGEIENVRVVRDAGNSIGKGFAFVEFAVRSWVYSIRATFLTTIL